MSDKHCFFISGPNHNCVICVANTCTSI